MITLTGTLQITTHSMVLQCSLGRFVLNDARLQDIPIGKHDGFFEIQKIEATVIQKSQGQMQLGLLAVIKEFSIKTVVKQCAHVSTQAKKINQQLSLLVVDDFLQDSTGVQAIAVEAMESGDELPNLKESPVEIAGAVTSTEIFENPTEESVTFPDIVELDVTLPRNQLRQKIQELQAKGYRFEKDRQLWLRAA